MWPICQNVASVLDTERCLPLRTSLFSMDWVKHNFTQSMLKWYSMTSMFCWKYKSNNVSYLLIYWLLSAERVLRIYYVFIIFLASSLWHFKSEIISFAFLKRDTCTGMCSKSSPDEMSSFNLYSVSKPFLYDSYTAYLSNHCSGQFPTLRNAHREFFN